LVKCVQESNTDEMRKSVDDLAVHIDNINIAVKKQNTVIAGLQCTIEITSKDLKESVDEKFDHLSSQINASRHAIQSLLPHSTLQALGQLMGQAGL
jgi:hypothetical protein